MIVYFFKVNTVQIFIYKRFVTLVLRHWHHVHITADIDGILIWYKFTNSILALRVQWSAELILLLLLRLIKLFWLLLLLVIQLRIKIVKTSPFKHLIKNPFHIWSNINVLIICWWAFSRIIYSLRRFPASLKLICFCHVDYVERQTHICLVRLSYLFYSFVVFLSYRFRHG